MVCEDTHLRFSACRFGYFTESGLLHQIPGKCDMRHDEKREILLVSMGRGLMLGVLAE